MKYEVKIIRSARKEMNKLPETIHERVTKRILSLEDNPIPEASKNSVEEKNIALELVTTEYYILLMTKMN